MEKILLDTNVLMAVGEMKLDVFEQLREYCDFNFKIYVLQSTIEELEKIIVEQRGKYIRAAKLALSLLARKKITILKKTGYADDLLVELSQRGYLVLTQDALLKKRLKRPYLTIRQQKRVMLVR